MTVDDCCLWSDWVGLRDARRRCCCCWWRGAGGAGGGGRRASLDDGGASLVGAAWPALKKLGRSRMPPSSMLKMLVCVGRR